MNKLQQLISESTIIDKRCKQCPNLIIPWIAWHPRSGPQRITFATCMLSKVRLSLSNEYQGICGECDPDNCEVNRS